VLNSYIAGYIGYLRLAEMGQVRKVAEQTDELVRLFILRAALAKAPASLAASGFECGGYRMTLHAWDGADGTAEFSYVRLGGYPIYDLSLPFTNLVPELGRFLGEYARRQCVDALVSYDELHPYWFVAKGEDTNGEGVLQPLYDTSSSFQAKALLLGEDRRTLENYLDVPGFAVGDLFYIQNLTAALERSAFEGR